MRAPLSWLRDFAPLDPPVGDLVSALSNLGLVVDTVTRVGDDLEGVEVVKILDIRAHPDADRIRLVDVDRGNGEALQIACGAANMAVGDLVALATVGTKLPGGLEIGRRRMRGQWSNGMLCAAEELGLPSPHDVDGLMILAAGLAGPGTPLSDALGLEPDVVFELDITPNRPDALCMAGVARDLAAALGLPFEIRPEAHPLAVHPSVETASVSVADPDLCPRFTGTVIDGVVVGPSPAWLARRLTLAGMRPISNVVDVSNYVMLDLGQPNHAYDLARLAGRGLTVRRARGGETITSLDGVERTLDDFDCLICDAHSVPVGIGGIMGGEDTEIGSATTTVLLEAAYFTPMAIARTGARLGLVTDARSRFERGVDPEMAQRAVERFGALLAATMSTGTELRRGPTTDVTSEADLARPPTVLLRTARVNSLLGTQLADVDIERLLRPIGLAATRADDGVHSVRIPSWRPDIEREVDVVEEVARLHGYGRIERTVPTGARPATGLTSFQRHRRTVREILVGAGLSEAWTSTFLAPGDLERAGLAEVAVRVANPLDSSESILRTALLPGLLSALRFNADRQAEEVALFEIGRTFARPSGDRVVPDENEELAAVVTGTGVDGNDAARLWALVSGALRLVGVTVHADLIAGLHPTRAARLIGADGTMIGAVGEVDADVVGAFGLRGRVAYLSADLERLAVQPRRPTTARPVSRYPASDIDLAFVVADGVAADDVEATVAGGAGPLLERLGLFDTYRSPQVGDGRRSLAYRLRFRAPDRTLTDAEVAGYRADIIAAMAAAHGAELRG
ncbi:MAG: phenylalanine--tRNA ligase subunit beta [Actinomycetota bacterium]|nr:phenylalanine--tRNA ligase subunit beta [Actinomycetota bacterium]MDQ6946874.1 phenylalanine--tRNA ligase subunit beta [Actinomycetota bacterium]